MVKVLLLVGFAGADFAWEPGSVAEVDEATAERMIAAGFAVRLDEPGEAETPEQAKIKAKRTTSKGK